jgi:AraC-like DNA-binding protein
MDIENLPKMLPKDFGDYGSCEDSRWPVLSADWERDGPHRMTRHAHPRAQIVYSLSGTYWAVTPNASWVLPAGQALWIPSRSFHDMFSNVPIRALILFVHAPLAYAMPQECTVITVSPLLREMFVRIVANGNDYAEDGPEARLAHSMLDELGQMEPSRFHIPMSEDRRLLRVMQPLIEDPASESSFEELASDAGASLRTLARLFKRETGLSFREWRRRLRLLQAIERLEQGGSVGEIAYDLGYSTPSAFIAMFRRTLGVPPGQYTRETRQGGADAHPFGPVV